MADVAVRVSEAIVQMEADVQGSVFSSLSSLSFIFVNVFDRFRYGNVAI